MNNINYKLLKKTKKQIKNIITKHDNIVKKTKKFYDLLEIDNITNKNKIIKFLKNYAFKNKFILYGGTAIDEYLNKNDKLYDYSTSIVDLDFLVINPKKESKNIVDIILTKFKNFYNHEVRCTDGFNPGTYKLYIDNIPFCDLTYIDSDLYNNLLQNSIIKNNFYLPPVEYLKCSMYLELSNPAGDISRWNKVLERLLLLTKTYPKTIINKKKCKECIINYNNDFLKQLFDYIILLNNDKNFRFIFTGNIVYDFYKNIDLKKNTIIDKVLKQKENIINIPVISILLTKKMISGKHIDSNIYNKEYDLIITNYITKFVDFFKKRYDNISIEYNCKKDYLYYCVSIKNNDEYIFNIFIGSLNECYSYTQYKNFYLISIDRFLSTSLLTLLLNWNLEYNYINAFYYEIYKKIDYLIYLQQKYLDRNKSKYFDRKSYCFGTVVSKVELGRMKYFRKIYDIKKTKQIYNPTTDKFGFKINSLVINKKNNQIGMIHDFQTKKNKILIRFPDKFSLLSVKSIKKFDLNLFKNSKFINNLINIGYLADTNHFKGFKINDKVIWYKDKQDEYKINNKYTCFSQHKKDNYNNLNADKIKMPGNNRCIIKSFKKPQLCITFDDIEYYVYPDDIYK